MSQAVGVRVARRLSGKIGRNGMRREFCNLLPSLEDDIYNEALNSLRGRDYPEAEKHASELVFLLSLKEALCPATPLEVPAYEEPIRGAARRRR